MVRSWCMNGVLMICCDGFVVFLSYGSCLGFVGRRLPARYKAQPQPYKVTHVVYDKKEVQGGFSPV